MMTSMPTPALAEATNRNVDPLVSTLSRDVCRYTGILEEKKTYQFPVLTASAESEQVADPGGLW